MVLAYDSSWVALHKFYIYFLRIILLLWNMWWNTKLVIKNKKRRKDTRELYFIKIQLQGKKKIFYKLS